jgi:hypothetical protein
MLDLGGRMIQGGDVRMGVERRLITIAALEETPEGVQGGD